MKILFLLSAVIFASVYSNRCPRSHPYVYYNGQYCCQSNREKFYRPQGKKCDRSLIRRDSLCCAGDRFIRCPGGNCQNYGQRNRFRGYGGWIMRGKTYLAGYTGGRRFYPDLMQAERACSRRRGCGGVTFERRANRFSLRRGTRFRRSPSGEISWRRGRNRRSRFRGYRGWIMRGKTYLAGYTGGRRFYPDLMQAERACSRRRDCGGVTFERRANRFSLRRGRRFRGSPSGEISWLKGGNGAARIRAARMRSYRRYYLKWRGYANRQRRRLHGYNVRYNSSRRNMIRFVHKQRYWARRANAQARTANSLRRSHAAYVRRIHAARRACNKRLRNMVRVANARARRQRSYHRRYVVYRRNAMRYKRMFLNARRHYNVRVRQRAAAYRLYNKYVRYQNIWVRRYNKIRG